MKIIKYLSISLGVVLALCVIIFVIINLNAEKIKEERSKAVTTLFITRSQYLALAISQYQNEKNKLPPSLSDLMELTDPDTKNEVSKFLNDDTSKKYPITYTITGTTTYSLCTPSKPVDMIMFEGIERTPTPDHSWSKENESV